MPAKQVLIVEDERPIREMIAFSLKRGGFEVREAEDCREARAQYAQGALLPPEQALPVYLRDDVARPSPR